MDYLERYQKLFDVLKSGQYEKAEQLFEKKENNFVQFIDNYISEHGLIRQSILRRADIAVSYGYKLLSGEKHTNNRNIILRLCLAMNMTLEDTQKCLSLYGMSSLTDSGRDAIITTGIIHQQKIDTIDDWLISMRLEPLFDSYDS